MKNLICGLIALSLFICKNNAQISYSFDKMPLDTGKWSATDTLFVDLNKDGLTDIVLFFDKYNALTRPNNIQTPVLFYLGDKKNNHYTFIDKSEKIIYSPYFEIKASNNMIIINQKGVGDDKNYYTNYYLYNAGKIIMCQELIEHKIEKLKVNNETGNVITIGILPPHPHCSGSHSLTANCSIFMSIKIA